MGKGEVQTEQSPSLNIPNTLQLSRELATDFCSSRKHLVAVAVEVVGGDVLFSQRKKQIAFQIGVLFVVCLLFVYGFVR